MKRSFFLLLAAAACRSAPSYTTSSDGQLAPPLAPAAPTAATGRLTGAPSPRKAVETFLASARAQDLQAMATIWGTAQGPARDVVDRSQLEKRELIMQCYLAHDRFEILSDTRNRDNSHSIEVSLSKGEITRQTVLTAVPGPAGRWYVQDVRLEPLRDLCASS